MVVLSVIKNINFFYDLYKDTQGAITLLFLWIFINMEKPPDKKLMSLFFDRKFRNTELTTRYYEGYLWTGFFISEKDNPKQDKLILGRTKDEDLWYSNGLYFFSGPSLLGITWSEFHDFLKDYVNENYPNLKIKRIS